MVMLSPALRLSVYVTVAEVVPSYVFPPPVMPMVSVLPVMLAVVVAVVFAE